jgi:hypothetical protein
MTAINSLTHVKVAYILMWKIVWRQNAVFDPNLARRSLHNVFAFFHLQGILIVNQPGDTLSPLSILQNPRWRPRWPPITHYCHILDSIYLRIMNWVSIPMFSGSMDPLKALLIILDNFVKASILNF